MDWSSALQVAGGISTFLGLAALIAVLFFWSEANRKSQALQDKLAGEIIGGDTVVEILKQFSTDEQRIQALSKVLRGREREAKPLLEKIKKDIDPLRLEMVADQNRLTAFKILAVTLVLLGVASLAGATLAATTSAAGKLATENGICSMTRIQQLENNIAEDLRSGRYSDVQEAADALQRCLPNSHRPWYFKGAAAFYSRDYQKAVEYFDHALRLSPQDAFTKDAMIENLADAYVEVGANTKALELYSSITARSMRVRYKFARAFVIGGRYREALPEIESVPTSFSEEGNRSGKARIVEAAAYAGLENAEKAVAQLREGVRTDRLYWIDILSLRTSSIHENWTVIAKLVQKYTDFIDNESPPK